jgi:hypothetical protein
MNALPIGVGARDEQEAFLAEHTAFLAHYPTLKQVIERALCRSLALPSQAEFDRLQGRDEGDPEVVAFENKAPPTP